MSNEKKTEEELQKIINQNLEGENRVIPIETMSKMEDEQIEILKVLRKNEGEISIQKLDEELVDSSKSSIMENVEALKKLELVEVEDSVLKIQPDRIIFGKTLK